VSTIEGRSQGDLTPLLPSLQAAIQREDANAERLDAKTRQLLALVGALFAVVQTLAFASYRQGKLGAADRVWLAGLALGAMSLLTASALASFRQQAALEVRDLDMGRIGDFIDSPSDHEILRELCRDHLTALWSRRDANLKRRNRYQATLLLATPAIVVIAAELIVAVAARIS
jgi:hypothetical protein